MSENQFTDLAARIYNARTKAAAEARKRSALNAHLPGPEQAMRRKGATFNPVDIHRGYPRWADLSAPLIALIGLDELLQFAVKLMDGLAALDPDAAATKLFEAARAQATNNWQAIQQKTDPAVGDLDTLFTSIFAAVDRYLPRDDGKLPPPAP
jgi:hypothetical protein